MSNLFIVEITRPETTRGGEMKWFDLNYKLINGYPDGSIGRAWDS